MIDTRKLREEHNRFLAAHRATLSQEMRLAGEQGVAEVHRNPPFKPRTGGLQRGTKARVIRTRNGGIVRLKNAKPHARPIEKGSRAHPIVARGRALQFTSGSGALIFRRRVNHPGNRPYRFLSSATKHAGQYFLGRMAQRMTEIARKF